jgi:hypothetical protein
MKNKFTMLIALLVLIALVSSSCGTTVYRGKKYKSKKYIGYKKHWFNWHAHHYRPHPHAGGGYW